MNKIIKVAVIILAVCGALYFFNNAKPVTRGVEGLGEPIQTKVSGNKQIQVDDCDINIEYKAQYKIDALVIHTKNYNGSMITDKLSPKDLALAWGDVDAKNGEIDFNWSQSGRWYYWTVSSREEAEKAGGTGYINTHSANCHIIPADDAVKKKLKSIKQGDRITIEGYLVYISGKYTDGRTFTWNSSLSRSDTGNGSCEVIYATSITKY